MKRNIIYMETKPELGNLRHMILEQAIILLQKRYEIFKKTGDDAKFVGAIEELISGFSDGCSSAVVGIVYHATDDTFDQEFKDWAFEKVLLRELSLSSGTWDVRYKGETTFEGFLSDFGLNKHTPLS